MLDAIVKENSTSLSSLRERLDEAIASYALSRKQMKTEKKALKNAKRYLSGCEKAQEVLQRVAQMVQEKAHEKIDAVVTHCLASVFDNPPEFKIVFDRKRGKTEARLVFIIDGNEFDPLRNSAGGEADISSLALRMICLKLSRPRVRQVLIADEPMKNVNGDENQQRVAELLLRLAKDMGIQLILVTDDEWLKIGKVIDL